VYYSIVSEGIINQSLTLKALQNSLLAEQNEAMIKFLAESSADSYREGLLDASKASERRANRIQMIKTVDGAGMTFSTVNSVQEAQALAW